MPWSEEFCPWQPLSAEMLAAAAGTIRFAAKANSYDQIIPWNPSDAITAEDAKCWLMANPNNAPWVNNFIAPATLYTGTASANNLPSGLSFSAVQSNPSDSPKLTAQPERAEDPQSEIEPETNWQNERKPTSNLVFH